MMPITTIIIYALTSYSQRRTRVMVSCLHVLVRRKQVYSNRFYWFYRAHSYIYEAPFVSPLQKKPAIIHLLTCVQHRLISSMYFNFLKMDFLNFEYMYLILSFILCGYCDTSNKHRSFWEISIMRNRSRHLNIMFTEKTRSKIECGIQCTLPCKSFSYNHETFTCRGYDVMISDNASSVLEGGWRTYGVQGNFTFNSDTETKQVLFLIIFFQDMGKQFTLKPSFPFIYLWDNY